MTNRCSPSQPDVIFVVMNALKKVHEDDLTAMRMVTVMNPTIAIQKAHAFDLSCPNRIVIANQNARAFGPSSILARKNMKRRSRSLVVALIKMIVAIRQNSIHHHFSESSASWPPSILSSLVFNFEDDFCTIVV